jgi:predicted phosphodiesterase
MSIAVMRMSVGLIIFVGVLVGGVIRVRSVNAAPKSVVPAAACTGEVRFVAIGDTGQGNKKADKVGKTIARVCEERGCDFVIHLGDIVYPNGVESGSDSDWKKKFEKPFADVIGVPWYFIMGNHDYGDERPKNPKPADAGPYLSYAKKHPGKFNFPAQSYSFHKGPVDFFAIDSTLLQSDVYRASVIATMKPKIDASEAPWRIAFAHNPIVSNGSHYKPSSAIVEGYQELFCNRKVHMVISGHDHTRQWFKDQSICPNTHLVVSGAATEVVPFKKKTSAFKPSRALYQDDGDNGFFYVRARCTTLYGAFYNDDGKIEFEYTVSK